MSKKAFPINRVNIDPPKPVRVAPNPPIALPEREPRNIWVMIGVPALIVALIGTIVMLYVSGVRSLATGQQAQLTLIDPKTAPHGLRDLHAPGYVRAYAYDQDEIDEVITELAQQILLPRLPPKGLSQEELRALKPWEGPRHFVLIDDVQDLRPAQSYPQKPPVGAALWKLMERARQVGLHVFSTRNSANWATMPMDP